MRKTHLMRRIEKGSGASIETLLPELLAEGYSLEKIAKQLDISYWTVRNWLKELNDAAPAVTP